MKLNHRDAINILGMDRSEGFEASDSTRQLIKAMYRQACSKYHPDRNPAGLEMMKLVNAAYEALSDVVNGGEFDKSLNDEASSHASDLGDEMNAALNVVIDLGLEIEICGSWIWVSGDTKPHREVLKSAGYRWAPKKLMWSFCGGERTSSRGKFSMEDIRSKHGSVGVKARDKKQIAA